MNQAAWNRGHHMFFVLLTELPALIIRGDFRCEFTDGLFHCLALQLFQQIAFIYLTFSFCRTWWNSCLSFCLLRFSTSSLCGSSHHPVVMLNIFLLQRHEIHRACSPKKKKKRSFFVSCRVGLFQFRSDLTWHVFYYSSKYLFVMQRFDLSVLLLNNSVFSRGSI